MIFDLIWEVVSPVFFGVRERCTWPKCEAAPEFSSIFTDGHVEPRCAAHKNCAATPEQ